MCILYKGKVLSGAPISPHKAEVHLTEGSDAILSCTYEGSPYSFLWYRQKPGARLEFLKLIVESTGYVQEADQPYGHMTVKFDGKAQKLDLNISSSQVSDSALYYCALQPTVMEAPFALHKN